VIVMRNNVEVWIVDGCFGDPPFRVEADRLVNPTALYLTFGLYLL